MTSSKSANDTNSEKIFVDELPSCLELSSSLAHIPHYHSIIPQFHPEKSLQNDLLRCVLVALSSFDFIQFREGEHMFPVSGG
jgi:hypothetical protein